MSLPTRIYYYQTISGGIGQYISGIPEKAMVSNLTKIGKGDILPESIGLPGDITAFFFPSGRIWYANGNHFVPESPARFRECMRVHKRQQSLTKPKKELKSLRDLI